MFAKVRVFDFELGIIWGPPLNWMLEPEQDWCVLRIRYPATSQPIEALHFKPLGTEHLQFQTQPLVKVAIDSIVQGPDEPVQLLTNKCLLELPREQVIHIHSKGPVRQMLMDSFIGIKGLANEARFNADLAVALSAWRGERQVEGLTPIPSALYRAIVGYTGKTREG